jgi:hypothetical protein
MSVSLNIILSPVTDFHFKRYAVMDGLPGSYAPMITRASQPRITVAVDISKYRKH